MESRRLHCAATMTLACSRCMTYKYVAHSYTGRNLCWPRRILPVVSHGEYADRTDRQTDGRQTVTLRFLLDAASVVSKISPKNINREIGKFIVK